MLHRLILTLKVKCSKKDDCHWFGELGDLDVRLFCLFINPLSLHCCHSLNNTQSPAQIQS